MRTVAVPAASPAPVVRPTAVFRVGTVIGIPVNSTTIETRFGLRIRGAGGEASGAEQGEQEKRKVFHGRKMNDGLISLPGFLEGLGLGRPDEAVPVCVDFDKKNFHRTLFLRLHPVFLVGHLAVPVAIP